MAESNEGTTVEHPDGTWGSIDWLDHDQGRKYLEDIRKAGITAVILDMTNIFTSLTTEAQWIQDQCAELGLQVAAAINAKQLASDASSKASSVYDTLVDRIPTGAAASNYFVTDAGKPLLVIYDTVRGFTAVRTSTLAPLQLFDCRWASGETSNAGKWGWQLEPWVGPVPSADAMFITSNVRWGGEKLKSSVNWRRSLSMLDYCMLLVEEAAPKYVVIGAYDDLFERNHWMVANTAGAVENRHTFDADGSLTTTALNDRVKGFVLAGTRPAGVPGGPIADGPYRIVSRHNDRHLVPVSATGAIDGQAKLAVASQAFPEIWWLYHLGSGKYRIVNVSTSLALAWTNGKLLLVRDSTTLEQIWTIHPGSIADSWLIVNEDAGLFFQAQGDVGVKAGADSAASPRVNWGIVPREAGYVPPFTPVYPDIV